MMHRLHLIKNVENVTFETISKHLTMTQIRHYVAKHLILHTSVIPKMINSYAANI